MASKEENAMMTEYKKHKEKKSVILDGILAPGDKEQFFSLLRTCCYIHDITESFYGHGLTGARDVSDCNYST